MTINFSNPEENTQQLNAAPAAPDINRDASPAAPDTNRDASPAVKPVDIKDPATYLNAETAEHIKRLDHIGYDLLSAACRLSELFDYGLGGDSVTIPITALAEIIPDAQMCARRAADEIEDYRIDLDGWDYNAATAPTSPQYEAMRRTLKQYAEEIEATKEALRKERAKTSDICSLYDFVYCLIHDRLTAEDREEIGEFKLKLYEKRRNRG